MNKFLFRVIIPILTVWLIVPQNIEAANSPTEIIVEKQDGTKIEGVLLNVDTQSQSLVVEKDGTGIRLNTTEINSLQYQRKNILGKSAGKGALIGGGLGIVGGVLINSHNNSSIGYSFGSSLVALMALGTAAIGSLIGVVASTTTSPYKTVQVRGESSKQIEKILKKLKKLALVND